MKLEEFETHFKQKRIDENFRSDVGQWTAMAKHLWAITDSTKDGFNGTLLRSLMVVLKALLDETNQTPLDNVLLR